MRISNFISHFQTGFEKHKSDIVKYQKEIEQNGISFEGTNAVSNTLAKLNRDDNVTILNQQIDSLKSIENNMNKYDINFQSMREQVDKFRELIIKRENDSVNLGGKTNINLELSSIIESIKNLENDKLNEDETLFGNETELITNNNQREKRSFGQDIIEINGNKISDILENIKNSNSDNNDILADIKAVTDKLDMNLTIVGSITSNSKKQIDLKELFKAHEEKYLDGLGNIEESITKMNEAINAYESSMLMYSKIQDLSLVKYL